MPTNKIFPLLNSGSHIGRVEGLFTIPEKEQIISVGEEGTIRVLNAITGATISIQSIHKKDGGNCLIYTSALSPDKQFLAIGGHLSADKQEIWIIRLADWTTHKVLKAHEGGVKALAYSKEGKWLMSGGQLGELKLWSTSDFQAVKLPKRHQGAILEVAVGTDAEFLVSAGRTGSLVYWKKQPDGSYISQKLVGHSSIPLSIAIAPNEAFFVSACVGGQLIGWDTQGNFLWSNIAFLPTSNALGAVSISPDSRYVAFKEDVSGFLKFSFKTHILEVPTKKIIYSFDRHKDVVLETVFYNNEEVVSANGGIVNIFMLNWQNNQIKHHWQSSGERIKQSKLTIDSELFLGYAPYFKRVNSGNGVYFSFRAFQIQPANQAPIAVAKPKHFEGKKLNQINDHELRITGGNTIRFNDHIDGRIQDFFFTKNGNILVIGDYAVNYFDTKGSLLQTFGGRAGELRTASLSEDNRYLSISGTDQITQLHNLETGELLASLFVSSTNEWAIWSPAGYYENSENGTDFLTWFQSKESELPQSVQLNNSQQKALHQPKLLKKIISLGGLEKALQTSTESILPSVRLSETTTTTRGKKYPLKFAVEAINQIKEIEVRLNKKVVYSNASLTNLTFFQVEESLTLAPGSNEIIVEVEDKKGKKTSESLKAFFDTTPKVLLSSGHTKGILDLAFSPDGKYIASSSLDNSLKIWNVNTGRLHQILDFATSEWTNISGVGGAAFHPTDPTKICAFAGNRIYVFDLTTGQIIHELVDKEHFSDFNKLLNSIPEKLPDMSITGINYSKNGHYILTVGMDGHLSYWNTQTGIQEHKIKIHEGGATALTTTKDGQYLITQGVDNFLKIFNSHNRQLVQRIPLSAKNVKKDFVGIKDFIDVAPNNSLIVVGGVYKDRLEVFNFQTGQKVYERLVKDGSLTSSSFSADNQYLAIGSMVSPIKILAATTGKEQNIFSDNAKTAQAIAFHLHQPLLISSHGVADKYTLKSWSVPTGDLLVEMGNDTRGVYCMDLSSNGQYLAASGVDKTVWIWDLATLNLKAKAAVGNHCLAILGTYDVAFNPTDSLLAISSCDKTVKILEVETNTFLQEKQFATPLESIAFHPHKDWLAVADTMVKIWDLSNNRLKIVGSHTGSVSKLQFSLDGKYLSCISKQELSLWDIKQEKKILTYAIPQLMPNQSTAADVSVTAMLNNISSINSYALVFSTDNQFLVFSGTPTGAIFQYHIPSNTIKVIQEKSLLPAKYLALALSPDNQFLAAGKQHEGTIEIFDLSKKQLIKTLSGHQKTVRQLLFNTSGKQLYSCSDDGTIKIWDWQDAKEEISLFSSVEGNYIFKTQDNYYHSNNLGQANINFSVDARILSFEQFDLQLNRPDIVLERLGSTSKGWIQAYKNAYLARLRSIDIKEENLELDFTSIPTVSINQPNSETYTLSKNYTFEVIVDGGEQAIKQLNVFVNDVPIYGRKGIEYTDKNQKKIRAKISLVLSNGRNKIQVSSRNWKGVESLKETFYINYNGQYKRPTLHLIAIGVNEYQYEKDLRYPEKDALDIVQLFQQQKVKYDQIKVDTLIGATFTRTALNTLKTKLQQTQVDDCVILFYAGHGFRSKDSLYLTSSTTNSYDTSTGIPYEEVEQLLDAIPARQKLILIDACYSGELDKVIPSAKNTMGNKPEGKTETEAEKVVFRDTEIRSSISTENASFDLMKNLFLDLRRGTGATVLAAAQGSQTAQESNQWENGVFTYAILKGLKEKSADFNTDGEITVSELKRYVSQKVLALTNGKQQPTSRLENISNDFRIW